MPTKNAHNTHENASGQNAALPIFVVDHAIRRISDKCLTCQTSQNISKMTCFSHAAKTRKKFSSLDSSKKSSVGWIVSSNAQSNEIPTKLQQNCNKHPTSQTSQT